MHDGKGNKLSAIKTGKVHEVIHVLSDVNRMQILSLLGKQGELCARDILLNFPITQPTLSHHMNILLENNLVISRKSGRWVFYRVSEKGIQRVIDFFESIKLSAGAFEGTARNTSTPKAMKITLSPKTAIRTPVHIEDETVLEGSSEIVHIKGEKKKDKSLEKPDKKDKKKKKKKK
jgi:DNA-binding transcriptional ArsR family regulator